MLYDGVERSKAPQVSSRPPSPHAPLQRRLSTISCGTGCMNVLRPNFVVSGRVSPPQNTAIICGPMRMLTPPSGLGCRSEVSQVIGVSITSPSRHRPTPLHLVLSASQSSCPMLRLPRVSALPRSLNWQLCTVRPDPCAAPARPLSPASSLPVRPTPHLQLLLLRGSGPSPLQPPCASSALAGAPCLASVPAARTARTARTARA